MTRSTRLRPLLVGLSLLLLLCGLQGPVSALYFVKDVSVAQAKELGIAVHAQPRPDSGDVRVTVSFKTTGALKGFRWADLELSKDGKQLVSAALMPRKPATDSAPEEKQVEFYIAPAALADASVTVVSYTEPLTGHGYRLRMKDYLPKAASR
jgi:hypothetical protein